MHGRESYPVLATEVNVSQRNEVVAKKVYAQLKDNEFRLVKLHAGSDGPIHCSLLRISDFTLKYDALSYMWGSQSYPKTIFINEETFYVTQNLREAILRLRRPSEDRLVWIDALAINQSDSSERSLQVANMANIYSNAETTVIWLGDGNHIINAILGSSCFQCGVLGESSWISELASKISRIKPDILVTLANMLTAVTELPYWSRVWVFQELMHSKKAAFTYGPHVVSLDRFEVFYTTVVKRLYNVANDLDLDLKSHMSYVFMARNLTHWKYGPGSARSGTLVSAHDWLNDFCPKRNCSDPRDKVFGFYNCLAPDLCVHINVDYTKSTREVFSEMVEALIRTTGQLETLNYVDKFSRNTLEPDALPSWVPNFAGEGNVMGSLTTTSERIPGEIPLAFYEISHRGTVLHVKGGCIGTAALLSDVFIPLKIGDKSESIDQRYNSILEHFAVCKQQLDVDEQGVGDFTNAFIGLDGGPEIEENLQSLLTGSHLSSNDINQQMQTTYDGSPQDIIYLWTMHHHRPMFTWTDAYPTKANAAHQLEFSQFHFGIGHRDMIAGDKIYVILGCSLPVIIRKVQGKYIIIGSASLDKYRIGGIRLQKDVHKINPALIESLSIY